MDEDNNIKRKLGRYELGHSHSSRNIIHWAIFVLVAFGLGGLVLSRVGFQGNTNEEQAAINKSKPPIETRKPNLETGKILIKTDKEKLAKIVKDEGLTTNAEASKELAKLGITSLNYNSDENTSEEVTGRIENKYNIHRKGGEVNPPEFVEVDQSIPPSLIANDPYLVGGSEWHIAKIQSSTAWDTTTGSPSVVIAILDTGVDGTHPDLAADMVPGWNFYNNNSDTADIYGHGTAVAGTAVAIGNNGFAVAGVAWNCKIMPIRISDTTGYATFSAMANGLIWAADHGARVANISYVATTSSTVTGAAQYFQSKGGVVTVSAGNYTTFDATADNPYILTVSATDSTDTITPWSNTGNNVDLSAPGVNIYTTARGGLVGSASGTSHSAPLVAGAAALMMSINPNLSAQQIQNLLKLSATDLGPTGWDTGFGWGRLNVAGAVALAQSTVTTSDTIAPTAPTNPVASNITSNSISLAWSSSTDNVGITGYQVFRNGSQAATSSTATFNDSGLTASTSYGYTIKALDAAGNVSASSSTVSATTLTGGVAFATVPYVVSKTTTSATIAWTTTIASTGVVNFGTNRTSLTGSQTDALSPSSHTITLTGLKPKTAYYFTVTATATGADGSTKTSLTSSFRTPAK